MRIALPILVLPLLALLMPLMFALAWMQEALGDARTARMAVRRRR